KAADERCGEALGEAAAAVARNACRFERYTYGYVKHGYPRLKATVEALVKLHAVATDDVVEEWLGHPSVLVRDALNDAFDDASARIKKLKDAEVRRTPRPPSGGGGQAPCAFALESFGEAPFRFGKRINGLAFEPNGTRLAVVGDGKGAIYDLEGREV